MVCDLDFNGRCELVLSGGSWYGAGLENRIYEISEDGDGYYEPEYAFLGIDSEECIVPQIANWNFLDAFYDTTAKTLTFETDQFSTYAIVYAAAVQSPSTDERVPSAATVIFIMGICGLAIVGYRRKRI